MWVFCTSATLIERSKPQSGLKVAQPTRSKFANMSANRAVFDVFQRYDKDRNGVISREDGAPGKAGETWGNREGKQLYQR